MIRCMSSLVERSRLAWRLAACVLLAHALPASAAAVQAGALAGPISICEDENEWPPISYFARSEGRKTDRLTGFAVDVIGDILSRHDLAYRIDMIPWARCLSVAKLGERYQMMLNLSASPERQDAFLFSRPYYKMASYYYYSRTEHPDGLPIAALADLKKYRICGVRGYNYGAYGLSKGEVDDGAKDFAAVIAKLHAGRCTLFVEHDDVMKGYALIGKDFLADPDLGKAPVPGKAPGGFRFGISRKFAQSATLKQLIDDELVRMEENGRLRELWSKYQRGVEQR
jgi:polar amino acid transport system substrate-binding protein